jgi:sulfate transport system ATP-binding protein
VALARALAIEPRVLLLDEPFGALDAKVRKDLRRWLRSFHQELGVTTVFVTHDQEEALELADTVVVMNRGRIEQTGPPQEVFDHPATPFVYEFLGDVNKVTLPGRPETFYVRPHEMHIVFAGDTRASFAAVIAHVFAAGPVARLSLRRLDNRETLEADITREQLDEMGLDAGDEVGVRVHTGTSKRTASPDGEVTHEYDL